MPTLLKTRAKARSSAHIKNVIKIAIGQTKRRKRKSRKSKAKVAPPQQIQMTPQPVSRTSNLEAGMLNDFLRSLGGGGSGGSIGLRTIAPTPITPPEPPKAPPKKPSSKSSTASEPEFSPKLPWFPAPFSPLDRSPLNTSRTPSSISWSPFSPEISLGTPLHPPLPSDKSSKHKPQPYRPKFTFNDLFNTQGSMSSLASSPLVSSGVPSVQSVSPLATSPLVSSGVPSLHSVSPLARSPLVSSGSSQFFSPHNPTPKPSPVLTPTSPHTPTYQKRPPKIIIPPRSPAPSATSINSLTTFASSRTDLTPETLLSTPSTTRTEPKLFYNYDDTPQEMPMSAPASLKSGKVKVKEVGKITTETQTSPVALEPISPLSTPPISPETALNMKFEDMKAFVMDNKQYIPKSRRRKQKYTLQEIQNWNSRENTRALTDLYNAVKENRFNSLAIDELAPDNQLHDQPPQPQMPPASPPLVAEDKNLEPVDQAKMDANDRQLQRFLFQPQEAISPPSTLGTPSSLASSPLMTSDEGGSLDSSAWVIQIGSNSDTESPSSLFQVD